MDAAFGETPLSRFLATQTLTQLRALKGQYREEIEATRERAEVLEAELHRIEQVIQEKSGTRSTGRRTSGKSGTSNGSTRRKEPAMHELILAVMRRRSGWWTRQEIFDELDKIGRAPKGRNPLNTLGNRLLEMDARGEVKRAGRGAFELPESQKDEEPVGTEPGAREKGSEEGAARRA